MTSRFLLADQTIDANDINTLIDWLKTDPWLTQGPLVQEFEQRWARWLGVNHAVFVNSGSSANLLMYYAYLMSGRLRNKKVIAPAVSWATTVAPAIQLGFEPTLCEASTQDFGLDMDYLEMLLKQHDPAVVVIVHVLGVPNAMEALLALKQKYEFVLMEDTCAATGSLYDGQLVGTFGEVSTFSFYFGHHLSTIEGGMVCTDDEELQDILLQIRSHGWAKNLAPEKQEERARKTGRGCFQPPVYLLLSGIQRAVYRPERANRPVPAREDRPDIKTADGESHNLPGPLFRQSVPFSAQRPFGDQQHRFHRPGPVRGAPG